VPEETNEWRELNADEVFTAFSARLASEAPPSAHSTAGGRDDDHEDDPDMARALCEFAQRHATRQGYGGWKHAYLRFDHRTRTRTTAHAPPHTHHRTRTRITAHAHAPDCDRWCGAGCTRWWGR
jgi:hypothetical protein